MSSKDDVDELIRLALWARKEGFRIADVEIGAVKLRIADLRLAEHEALKTDPRRPSIWQEHGAPDDEDDPVPGTIG